MPSLINLLDTLRKEHENPDERDAEDMAVWAEKISEIVSIQSLEQIEGIRLVITKFTSEIRQINEKILSDRDMSQEERKNLFDKRAFMLTFIGIFMSAKAEEENLAKTLQENIEHLRNIEI